MKREVVVQVRVEDGCGSGSGERGEEKEQPILWLPL